jgi:Arc/MetJ-type ribon-helix-helix transcriptional regulator
MARGTVIGVALSAKELKLLRDRVRGGGYLSESDVIRASLRQFFRHDGRPAISPKGRHSSTQLATAYRSMAALDRKLAREWSSLKDPWPNT